MSETLTMSASEFKAKCLDIFTRLSNRSLERVVITKRGQPVAVLTPPEPPPSTFASLHGFMRGSVILPPDLDLTEPVIDVDDIAAMKGILHY